MRKLVLGLIMSSFTTNVWAMTEQECKAQAHHCMGFLLREQLFFEQTHRFKISLCALDTLAEEFFLYIFQCLVQLHNIGRYHLFGINKARKTHRPNQSFIIMYVLINLLVPSLRSQMINYERIILANSSLGGNFSLISFPVTL